MTTIRYFIPEDGDQEHQPNVFLAPKSRQQGYPPTLEQIKSTFPLPGKYHFRFKSSLTGSNSSSNGAEKSSNNLAVWMDWTDDRLPVPVYQTQIIAKITRIGVEDDDDDEDDEDFRRPASTSSTAPTVAAMGVPLSQPPPQQQQQQRAAVPPQQQQTASVAAAAPSFDLFGDGPTAPVHNNINSNNNSNNMSVNLFDTPHTSTNVGGSSSLLDMNYQQPHHNSGGGAHSDFLGMTTAPSPPVSGNANSMYGGYPQQQQPPPPQQQRPYGSSGTGGGAFGDLAWK